MFDLPRYTLINERSRDYVETLLLFKKYDDLKKSEYLLYYEI